jgi:hypothetical protein
MKKVLIAAVASSLATGGVIAATGVAGSSDNTKKTSPPPTMSQALKDMQKQRDEHLARVAKRLDISADKLKDAIDKVRHAELQDAVDSGRLTEAERDAILACEKDPLTCDRSDLPAFGPGLHRHVGPRAGASGKRMFRRELRGDRGDFLNALAKELDVPVAKVRAAFAAERPKFERGDRRFGPGGPPPGPPPGGAAPGTFEAPAAPPPGDPA